MVLMWSSNSTSMEHPLAKYDEDHTDMYLEALSMAYEVNLLIFQSTAEKCEVIENSNIDNLFEDNVYVVRISKHFDAVVPIYNSDSDDSVTVTHIVDGDDTEVEEVKIELPPPSKRSSAGTLKSDKESTEKRTPGSYEMDYTATSGSGVSDNFDYNNPTSGSGLPDNFDYGNPSAETLFQCLLVDPSKYEVATPLKRVRENKVYTVRNCVLSDITCDDNGAYHKSNRNTKDYFVEKDENSGVTVKILRTSSDGSLFFMQRVSRQYKTIYPPSENIHKLSRYYRFSKTIPGLKMMVAHAEAYHGEACPYFCVVYSLDETSDDLVEVKCAPHGNSKQPDKLARPYVRTNPSVLAQIDNTLLHNKSQSSVFHQVLSNCGGPMNSPSLSDEPRNIKQVDNRKTRAKIIEAPTSFGPPLSDVEKLIRAQRDPESPVRTVLVWRDSYIAFIYTDKMLQDIEMFCCDEKDQESCVLGIDTTFKLCNMWVTDTCYRNKRLLGVRSRKNPVNIGPVMFHRTKDEETFRRFCVELLSANPKIINLQKIGVDMEEAIFNGFQSVIVKLLQLYCAKHLQDRDMLAIDKCHSNSNVVDERKARYKNEIIWDIYGKRSKDAFEKGIAESTDADQFTARLMSLQPRWEKLCPGFYKWFLTHRKKEFIESVIQSAREGTNVCGLYYQNDIESQHAAEKRIQCFKLGSVMEAVSTVKTMIEREETDEILALYAGNNYVLSQPYRKWFSVQWHSWSQQRKDQYLKNFRSARPSVEDTFISPVNSGQKANYRKRIRLNSPPSVVVDRHAPTTLPTLVTTPTTSTTTTAHTVSSSAPSLSAATTNNDDDISFPDPRHDAPKTYTLLLKELEAKSVVKCYGNCGRTIQPTEVLIVRSYGLSTWVEKGKEKSKYGRQYLHFKASCLKNHDSETYYAPGEEFTWSKITISPLTKENLKEKDRAYLQNMGIV